MIPYKVNYHRPASVAEALDLMDQFGDACKIIAGGHTLVPLMKLRLAEPENLIDIRKISELTDIHENSDSIVIGACATHGDISQNALIKDHIPMMVQAGEMVGDIQVRNFGTIGGSIAHADPSADWPAVLMAADAYINVQGKAGSRSVSANEFFFGLYMTALQDGEMIVSVSVPKSAANQNSTYLKFPQPASRFALVGCAAAVAVDASSDSVDRARVAFSGVSNKPFRDEGIENALVGKSLDAATIDAATSGAAEGIHITADHYATEKYRKHLASVFANRALSALA
jgi:carbon-monoxide dehydrogenase medium subunit